MLIELHAALAPTEVGNSISGKTPGGPEHQQVRLPVIDELLRMGWHQTQLRWSPEWRVPKSPSEASKRESSSSFSGWPVDLVLFDDENHNGSWEDILVVFEFKAPTLRNGVSQLEIYLNREPRARMGYWTNGAENIRVYRLADGTFGHVRNQGLPQPGETFSLPSTKPLVYDDLRVPTSQELRAIFRRLLDVIVARDSRSTRSEARLNEVCNLLLIKMESDTVGQDDTETPLGFQLMETEDLTARHIRRQFAELRARRPQIFTNPAELDLYLDEHSIHQAVYELSGLDLLEVRPEALSAAFQIFRTANLKAGEGQYYTPARVITAATAVMDIRASDRVIDPACGTGGFLSEAFLHHLERTRSAGPNAQAKARTWAHRNLYGVDKDEINVKLTRAILMSMGDGSVNVLTGDSVREHRWGQDYPKLELALGGAKFSVVLTNPPFGQGLRVSKADSKRNRYSIAQKGGRGETAPYFDLEIGLVFVERAYRLLEEGGRLGIVLPETYFFSSSYAWFPEWLERHFILRAVINIPMEAFQGFCRAKTNFYVMERK